MNPLIDWLVQGEPWVEYRTRRDLLGQRQSTAEARAAYQAMLNHPQVKALLAELAGWPVKVIASHRSAGHPLHKLTFLADLGLKARTPGLDRIITRVMKHRSEQGPFQMLMNIHPRHGGTGKDQWAWALCDAPLLVYALTGFGLGRDPHVRTVRPDIWPGWCATTAGPVPLLRNSASGAARVAKTTLVLTPTWRCSKPCL